VDLIKGASILAARIADEKRRRETERETSPQSAAENGALRCVDCGGAIADVLASLGSIRCHDCRSSAPQH
jgi:hypothetical protein